MTTLVVTRGIPASGKTTWAREWVAEDEDNRCRVNRDDLRQNLYGRDAPLPHQLEEALTTMQHAGVRKLLQCGRSVVVDDMHLRRAYIDRWQAIAEEQGAELAIMEFQVDVEVCVARDRARGEAGGREVGEEFIRQCHQRLTSSIRSDHYKGGVKASPAEPVVPALYVPDTSLSSAWLVDMDGTLAVMRGRGPYDWGRVGEDDLNHPVRNVVCGLKMMGFSIVVVSGRDAVCRDETAAWLQRHSIPYHGLYMRPEGDNRRDALVKRELLEEIGKQWRVAGVLDDRDQVVEMWRAVGLPCLQVAEGSF